MMDVLRDVAMTQYAKLEYPVEHVDIYLKGFEAGVEHVYNVLREEQLKEVNRVMDKVLDALVSWKPEVEE